VDECAIVIGGLGSVGELTWKYRVGRPVSGRERYSSRGCSECGRAYPEVQGRVSGRSYLGQNQSSVFRVGRAGSVRKAHKYARSYPRLPRRREYLDDDNPQGLQTTCSGPPRRPATHGTWWEGRTGGFRSGGQHLPGSIG
jgi:hypothetical protein